jgi:hypothetical protein
MHSLSVVPHDAKLAPVRRSWMVFFFGFELKGFSTKYDC